MRFKFNRRNACTKLLLPGIWIVRRFLDSRPLRDAFTVSGFTPTGKCGLTNASEPNRSSTLALFMRLVLMRFRSYLSTSSLLNDAVTFSTERQVPSGRDFDLLLVRTFRRTFPRHFVPGYDRCCPSGTRWQTSHNSI